jgi:putative DNA primase/helicase
MDMKTMALAAIKAGMAPIPIRAGGKVPLDRWTDDQHHPMDETEIPRRFRNGCNLGIVCGAGSGNLECLDFDNASLFQPLLDTLEAVNPSLRQKLTVWQETPSGGYHLLYRCSAPVGSNAVLAHGRNGKAAIETRGQGGQFLVAPSRATSKQDGKQRPYILHGTLQAVPTITAEDVALLHNIASSFDESGHQEQKRLPRNQGGTISGDRPGDRYNHVTDWNELLVRYGWRCLKTMGDRQHWQRPGKTGPEASGTLHPTKGFWCFSTSTPLPTQQPLTPFAVFTYMEYGGDFVAAARALAAEHTPAHPIGEQPPHPALAADPTAALCAPCKPVQPPAPLPDHPAVAPFEHDLLPDTLAPWVRDIAERLQCPPDFVAVAAMVALAVVVGRKVAIRPKRHDTWAVIANLWALVIGRPGIMKTPAIEATFGPLDRLMARALEEHDQAMQRFEADKMAAKLRAEAREKKARERLKNNHDANLGDLLTPSTIESPTLRRYRTNDTSTASLGELLRQNPNGMLVYRDELVSLLKGLDKEDQAEGRGFYLTGWNDDSPYTLDRIGRGLYLHIPALCISLLGGTQPGRLAEYTGQAIRGGAADDGLIQRFGLMVWPDPVATWRNVDRPPDHTAERVAYAVFDRLDRLDPASIGAQQDRNLDGHPIGLPYLRFSAEALSHFQEWHEALEVRLRSGELHPALESHFSKYRKLVPALALLIHLADDGRGEIGEDATLKALAWAEYLETHAHRVYGAVTQVEVAAAKAILRRIERGDLQAPFTTRDVWRPGWAGLSDRALVVRALELLADYGHLTVEVDRETGGRPATRYRPVQVEGER